MTKQTNEQQQQQQNAGVWKISHSTVIFQPSGIHSSVVVVSSPPVSILLKQSEKVYAHACVDVCAHVYHRLA